MFPYPEHDTTGSVGRALPGLDVKLVDDNGNDISDYDVRGEMCIRGPSVIKGYLDNPEANKSWDEDGYFHTGDIMYCDGKTKLWYIEDRKKVDKIPPFDFSTKTSR
jgi:4-coumarate--CoA ligase